MIAEADILKMTKEERVDAINMLWNSLQDDSEDDFESPEWHVEVLAERTRRMDAGEEPFYTLEEAWRKLEEFKALHRK